MAEMYKSKGDKASSFCHFMEFKIKGKTRKKNSLRGRRGDLNEVRWLI